MASNIVTKNEDDYEKERRDSFSRSRSHSNSVSIALSTTPRNISETTIESDSKQELKKSVTRKIVSSDALGKLVGLFSKSKHKTDNSRDFSSSREFVIQNQQAPRLSTSWHSLGEQDDAFAGISKALLAPELSIIPISVIWRKSSYRCHVLMDLKVFEVVENILKDLFQQGGSNSELFSNPLSFMIGKVDRKLAGTRIWLQLQNRICDYDISHGDELVLKHISDTEKIIVRFPPSSELQTFNFGCDMLVGDTIRKLKENVQINAPNVGLYYPSFGMWLDETKTLFCYNFEKENFHFMIQFQNCNIQLWNNKTIAIPVDELSTVSNTAELLGIMLPEILNLEPKLHSPLYEPLGSNEKVWAVIDSLGRNDKLYFAPGPQQLFISSDSNREKIAVSVDFFRNLEYYCVYFCTKLGVSPHCFQYIKGSKNNKTLSLEKPIKEILDSGGHIILVIDEDATPSPDSSGGSIIWYEAKLEPHPNPSLFTLNQLVERLTADNQSENYLEFVKTFLSTFTSFTTPFKLLEKLSERYSVPNLKKLNRTEFEKYKANIQIRVANSLLLWTRKYPAAFLHPETGQATCEAALKFIDQRICLDNLQIAKQIRKNVVGFLKMTMEDEICPPFHKSDFAIVEDVTNTKALSFTSLEIAEQLTIIESWYFTRILPSEFLKQAWMSKQSEKQAPNIIKLTARFNAVAWWVVQCILEPKTPKARSERVTKIIDIAQALLQLQNYSTLLSVIAGMNKACISRLSATFKEVPQKYLKKKVELEKLMSAESSYKNYRASIHSVAPPCIPYIGTYLTDLTYMEDGNPDTIDGLVNFAKREMIGNVIREVMEYQQLPYNIKPIEELGVILGNLAVASKDLDKRLWDLSKARE